MEEPSPRIQDQVENITDEDVSVSQYIKICAEAEKLWIVYMVGPNGRLCFEDLLQYIKKTASIQISFTD